MNKMKEIEDTWRKDGMKGRKKKEKKDGKKFTHANINFEKIKLLNN